MRGGPGGGYSPSARNWKASRSFWCTRKTARTTRPFRQCGIGLWRCREGCVRCRPGDMATPLRGLGRLRAARAWDIQATLLFVGGTLAATALDGLSVAIPMRLLCSGVVVDRPNQAAHSLPQRFRYSLRSPLGPACGCYFAVSQRKSWPVHYYFTGSTTI